ncbi:hypothetical protein BGZ98_002000 [Dissophora globulifera]|nr:hypothetical protein BGZ98_002000 [Dissophora globulifera]
MNLPSPDEQLDLHGPRAQLPFEQTPPQSRAGIKSSHESLEQDKTLIVSNGIITSGGTQNSPRLPQEILVSPASAQDQSRPGRVVTEPCESKHDSITVRDTPSSPAHPPGDEDEKGRKVTSSPTPAVMLTQDPPQAMENMVTGFADGASNNRQHLQGHGAGVASTSLLSRLSIPWSRFNLISSARNINDAPSLSTLPSLPTSRTAQPSHTRPAHTAPTPSTLAMMHNSGGSSQAGDPLQRRPLTTAGTGNNPSFGTFATTVAQDFNGPPPKPTRVESFLSGFKRFMGFVGPGYIISVGYMDPGNWATDLAGGSSFGYMLLFVILLSNLMAIVLQGLAVKLGVVSGLDLAQACRKFTPKYINWILYALAELAIIACDLAEVIGSAIALNLLFKIPLPWGVVITAADVLLILFAFRDDQSVKSRRLFEALVIILVSTVGICFTVEIAYAQPVAKDVFKGFLPSSEILTNTDALFLAIGIIGATVMPHNLYLHSSIVKLRTTRELNKLASSQASMSSTSDLMTTEQRQVLDEDKGAISMKHSTIRSTLKYTFWDSTVALTFALYVNSAILIVSAATFKYKYPEQDNSGLADFFSAFQLLSQALGKAAGYVFAVALLMAGQSSTLTATLAGQIIMEGFLGVSYLKPWVRRLATRCLAIIPALVIVIIKGQSGLSQLLLASQVALSIQLPFAVIPLVLFTSMGRCMTIPVQDNDDKPGELSYGVQSAKDLKAVQSSTATTDVSMQEDDSNAPRPSMGDEHQLESTAVNSLVEMGVSTLNPNGPQPLLLHNFANAWWLMIIAGLISLLLLGLNFYLLVQTIQGN